MTPTVLDRRVGWLGTGRMGAALARRLLAAGCDVLVYNRTRSRAEPLAEHGATVTATAGGLAVAGVVFITVGTSQDLLDAVARSEERRVGKECRCGWSQEQYRKRR